MNFARWARGYLIPKGRSKQIGHTIRKQNGLQLFNLYHCTYHKTCGDYILCDNVKSKLIFTIFFFQTPRCITTIVENLRVQMHPSLRLILDIVIFIADIRQYLVFFMIFVLRRRINIIIIIIMVLLCLHIWEQIVVQLILGIA